MPLPRSSTKSSIVLVVELDLAAHQVADDRRALGHPEPQHAAGSRLEPAVARVAVVAGLAAGLGPLLDLFGRQVAVVGVTRIRTAAVAAAMWALAYALWKYGPSNVGSSDEMPIHANDSMIPSVHSGRLRASSVSSMRSTNVPPSRRASAQL